MKFIEELKKRNVIKTIGIYSAAALITIQVADIVFPRLLLPDWTVTFIIILVIIGFPVTFFLSWTYNLDVNSNVSSIPLENEKQSETTNQFSLTKKIIFPLTGLILTMIGGVFWFVYPFLTLGMGHEQNYDASIAILYMENMSSDKNSYFADGLTEELINRLSRIQNLKVRPRTDVAVYKNNMSAIDEIAEDLNVNYIVEGSVRIVDKDLRVNAKLIDTNLNELVWSESYNNKLTDIFDVQDGIAEQIVSQLDKILNISKADIVATQRKSTQNMEAYNLVQYAEKILVNQRLSGETSSKMILPLLRQALELDSTYVDALSLLAIAKFIKYDDVNKTTKDEEKDINDAKLIIEKALSYAPDHESSLALSIMIPLFEMRNQSENYDLFMMRKLAMRMDRYIAKFPDSPFTLSMSGFYYGIKYQMFGNESDIELGLTNLLRSHSILKNSLSKISDLGQIWANQINFQTIPALYLAQKKNDEALKFVTDNKQMICQDGTYDCLDAGSLIMLENGFYHSFQYKEAIEIIEISLNRTQDELTLEGEDFGVKAQAYYRYGMINMKWEEHDKAIEGFTNALKVITDEYNKDFWQPHYHRRLGLVHSKLGNYKKAAEHYYQSYQEIQIQITNNDNTENLMDDEHKTKTKAICSNAYMEALLGSLESAEKSISECTEWLDNNADKINDAHDAYETYWQLYLYYNNLKNKTEAKKYLNLAYESIEKNKIKRWIGKPNRDTDPKYFYSRDIIKTYENN